MLDLVTAILIPPILWLDCRKSNKRLPKGIISFSSVRAWDSLDAPHVLYI